MTFRIVSPFAELCRYKQLWEEGEEDDAELVDEVSHTAAAHRCLTFPQAAYHDRAWDDWKDNNKKGSGNKMGKRY